MTSPYHAENSKLHQTKNALGHVGSESKTFSAPGNCGRLVGSGRGQARRACRRHSGEKAVMGEWKAQLSLRVRQELRRDLEEFAAKERRTLGNLGEILLEWAFEQLKRVGSTE